MITWVLFKMKAALAFAWLKKNWLVVSLVCAMAALTIYQMVTRKNDQKSIEELQRQLDKARMDFEQARNNHRNEILRRDEIEENYRKVIADLTAKYGAEIAKLDIDKQARVRQVIQENKDDPQAMATRLNNVLGIQLYQPSTSSIGVRS